MAVVINEFEVVPAAPATRGADAPPAHTEQSEQPPDRDVERMMERRLERSERVWAH
jgi:hypothetical protein